VYRALSLQVIPWNLPYNWGESTVKLQRCRRNKIVYFLLSNAHYLLLRMNNLFILHVVNSKKKNLLKVFSQMCSGDLRWLRVVHITCWYHCLLHTRLIKTDEKFDIDVEWTTVLLPLTRGFAFHPAPIPNRDITTYCRTPGHPFWSQQATRNTLKIGTESFPETSGNLRVLTRLSAREHRID